MADPEEQTQPEEEPKAPVKEKEVLAQKVTGTVKWFNVKSGYGFINRHDTKEDVFVHQSAITKNNPRKYVRSVGDGEEVEFDVVIGEKGNEAANVTGPGGEAVKGSPYAADRRRGYRRRYYRRLPNAEDGEVEEESGEFSPPMRSRGRGRGGFGGRGPRRFYRGRFFGRGRGRGGRGGPQDFDNQGYMSDQYEGEMLEGSEMNMRGRSRGQGRGRGFPRGRGGPPRGGGAPRGYFRRFRGFGAPGPRDGGEEMIGPDARRRPRRGRGGRGRRGPSDGTNLKGESGSQENGSAPQPAQAQPVENTTAESNA